MWSKQDAQVACLGLGRLEICIQSWVDLRTGINGCHDSRQGYQKDDLLHSACHGAACTQRGSVCRNAFSLARQKKNLDTARYQPINDAKVWCRLITKALNTQ